MKRRRLQALALAAALSAALGACAGPYVDSRREAGQKQPVGPSTPDMVAICYSSHGGTDAQRQALADSECAKTGRKAQFDHEAPWSCTLVDPTRAFYRCVAKP